ncbi:unnamed protein product [Pieris macdunnoughi]|uniref:DDE Tnp4 domain-containing protein n=1 Tax=Pieris macdunnoughi TaxID=345717 RepID=A0A821XN31_9NEOP|nr:unnamed protein product [Pieris macdunnoughi]
MSVNSFDELLSIISQRIKKQDTNMRRSITPAERLAVTLRYLASGATFTDLEYDFLISRKTIPFIVTETCQAIWQELAPLEMPTPNKGKVVDADYCFTFIDVGAPGREGDSSIFKSSNFGQKLTCSQLDLPEPAHLPNNIGKPPVPFVFIGDAAFGLNKNVMRPFSLRNITTPKKIYNYRLSRDRRFVECAFGILSNRWRIFHSSIMINPLSAKHIIKAACVLHNFVRRRDYQFEDTIRWYDDMEEFDGVQAVGGRSCGIAVRDSFVEYFNGPGAVPWQNRMIH